MARASALNGRHSVTWIRSAVLFPFCSTYIQWPRFISAGSSSRWRRRWLEPLPQGSLQASTALSPLLTVTSTRTLLVVPPIGAQLSFPVASCPRKRLCCSSSTCGCSSRPNEPRVDAQKQFSLSHSSIFCSLPRSASWGSLTSSCFCSSVLSLASSGRTILSLNSKCSIVSEVASCCVRLYRWLFSENGQLGSGDVCK